MNIDHFPNEIIFNVFSYMNISELGYCCQVNKKWNLIASDSALWKKFLPESEVKYQKEPKQYIQSHFISKNKIIDYFKIFAERINLDQKGEFICVSPFEFSKQLSIELSHNRYSGNSRDNIHKITERKIIITEKTNTHTKNDIKPALYHMGNTINSSVATTADYYDLKTPIFLILDEWKKKINELENKRKFTTFMQLIGSIKHIEMCASLAKISLIVGAIALVDSQLELENSFYLNSGFFFEILRE